MTKEEFLKACKSAQVVETPRGLAIMVAGRVFEVNCPPVPAYDDEVYYVHWLAEALRADD